MSIQFVLVIFQYCSCLFDDTSIVQCQETQHSHCLVSLAELFFQDRIWFSARRAFNLKSKGLPLICFTTCAHGGGVRDDVSPEIHVFHLVG